MEFKTLGEKCLYYRGLADYKLMPNSYVLVSVDGRSFSHRIKKQFDKPFDDVFIDIMNQTAQHLCKNIQGCKFAYTQSDEISLVLTDFDTPTTDAFFNNRLCKIQSLVAAMATSKFNQLMILHKLNKASYDKLNDEEFSYTIEDSMQIIENEPLYEFDCRAWNVPTFNDVYAYFLWRQIDCIRNSKQQTAQTYLSHKELMNKNTDEQIILLRQKIGVKWESFKTEWKCGRFIRKVEEEFINDKGETYIRNLWKVFPAEELINPLVKFKLMEYIPVLK